MASYLNYPKSPKVSDSWKVFVFTLEFDLCIFMMGDHTSLARCEKTGYLYMRKQRRRSASQ